MAKQRFWKLKNGETSVPISGGTDGATWYELIVSRLENYTTEGLNIREMRLRADVLDKFDEAADTGTAVYLSEPEFNAVKKITADKWPRFDRGILAMLEAIEATEGAKMTIGDDDDDKAEPEPEPEPPE